MADPVGFDRCHGGLVKGLIFRVFVVGYVLNQIQSAVSLQRIFVVVGLLALLSFACHLVNILLKNCFFPKVGLKDSVPLHEAGF